MPTLWCPKCRSEYREGVSVCSDCGSELVDTLPPRAKRHRAEQPKVVGPFLPNDDLVAVTTMGAVDAELVAAQLRSSGIPAAVFGVGTAGLLAAIQHAEGSRVMVRRADVEVAAAAIAALLESDPELPIDDAELADLAERSAGWSDPSSGAVV